MGGVELQVVSGSFSPTSLHVTAPRWLVWISTLHERWLIIVEAVGAADDVRVGPRPLDDMCQLMRQQPLSFTRSGVELTSTKFVDLAAEDSAIVRPSQQFRSMVELFRGHSLAELLWPQLKAVCIH